ncbi:MAG TPA: hydrolase [Planctomycetota bacterium]|nr:hydrolase [Planctomycetota bacterium]
MEVPPRLEKSRVALVLVDVQERFRDLIDGMPGVVAQCSRLVRFFARLGLPVVVTEQYPARLGRTVPELASVLPSGAAPIEKVTFSCGGDEGFRKAVAGVRREQWVLSGIEAHVCVCQTALDLVRDGRQVALAADATSSRRPRDRDLALARMRDSGVQVMSTEMVLFEILRQAGTDDFRAVAPILKE